MQWNRSGFMGLYAASFRRNLDKWYAILDAYVFRSKLSNLVYPSACISTDPRDPASHGSSGFCTWIVDRNGSHKDLRGLFLGEIALSQFDLGLGANFNCGSWV